MSGLEPQVVYEGTLMNSRGFTLMIGGLVEGRSYRIINGDDDTDCEPVSYHDLRAKISSAELWHKHIRIEGPIDPQEVRV